MRIFFEKDQIKGVTAVSRACQQLVGRASTCAHRAIWRPVRTILTPVLTISKPPFGNPNGRLEIQTARFGNPNERSSKCRWNFKDMSTTFRQRFDPKTRFRHHKMRFPPPKTQCGSSSLCPQRCCPMRSFVLTSTPIRDDPPGGDVRRWSIECPWFS